MAMKNVDKKVKDFSNHVCHRKNGQGKLTMHLISHPNYALITFQDLIEVNVQ